MGSSHAAAHSVTTGEHSGVNTVCGCVSVIIPAYNAVATIERTISSVLHQSYPNLEVLVVDDGSTDETPALIRRIADADGRVRLFQKPNGGLVSARNYGIAHASGEFIAPVDADDLWHPEKIEKQVAVMRKHGDEVGLVYTWGRGIDEQDRIVKDLTTSCFRGEVYAALIMKGFVGSGSPLVRRRCLDEIGGYDPTLAGRGATCCEDFKFSLDVAERYHFDVVPEFLWGYRFRAGSMSKDLEAMLRSHVLVLCDARPRHPELPRKLFRWAMADQYLRFSLYHFRDRHLLRGAQLLLRALWNDPFGTVPGVVRQVYARMARSSAAIEFTSVLFHCGDEGRSIGRKFLDADPSAFCTRPRPLFNRRRLAYIGGLRAQGMRRFSVAATRLS